MILFCDKRQPWRLALLAGLLTLLTTLAACGAKQNNASLSSTSTVHQTATVASTGATNPTTTATTSTVASGPVACPTQYQGTTYWQTLLSLKSSMAQVEGVSCGHLKGDTSLQALLTVRYSGSGSQLDVYVFDQLNTTHPQQIFVLKGLYMGSAAISQVSSVVTSEVDLASSVNNGQSNAGVNPDLDREFAWSAGTGKMVQVVFPGLFPDLTRYQAEADQKQVNQGHQPWKLSATMTAQALGAGLLHWNPDATATLVSGGGANDTTAMVNLKNTMPADGILQINLQRLATGQNSIWEVTGVASSSALAITSPKPLSQVSNPVTVNGTGNAFEGVIGQIEVLDHTDTVIGRAQVTGSTGMGNTTFSTAVSYTSTFHNGHEEGILFLEQPSNATSAIATAMLVKVLL